MNAEPQRDAGEPNGADVHHRHLGRAFNWLGGATIVAKVIDFSTIVAVLLLTIGTAIVRFCFPARTGIVAVSAVWLGVYPLLLTWGVGYLRRQWEMRITDLVEAFTAPLIGIGAMVLLAVAARWLVGTDDHRLHLGMVIAAMALTYGGLFRHGWQRTA
jgi:hypothetical protein